jgi:hypothetical protein
MGEDNCHYVLAGVHVHPDYRGKGKGEKKQKRNGRRKEDGGAMGVGKSRVAEILFRSYRFFQGTGQQSYKQ